MCKMGIAKALHRPLAPCVQPPFRIGALDLACLRRVDERFSRVAVNAIASRSGYYD
jgi:hypothetical protein